MSDLVLIDTSDWVRFFREGKENHEVADEVERLLNDELASFIEPVYLELVVGAKVPEGLERLRQRFVLLPPVKGRRSGLAAGVVSSVLVEGEGLTGRYGQPRNRGNSHVK